MLSKPWPKMEEVGSHLHALENIGVRFWMENCMSPRVGLNALA